MANRILQLFRNETFYTDRTTAKAELENKLKTSSEDGVPMIARYEDNGKVKTILGISASGSNFTIWDAEAIPADVQDKLNTITGSGDGSFVEAINNAIQSLDVTDDAVSGKVVKAVSEADGKISVSRDFLADTDIKIVAKESGLAETSLAEYTLQNGNSVDLGATIVIPKDKSLESVEMVESWTEGDVEKTGLAFKFTYNNSKGGQDIVYLDTAKLLYENEFGNGLDVTEGKVSVKIAEGEEMLECTEDGLSLKEGAAWDCGTW